MTPLVSTNEQFCSIEQNFTLHLYLLFRIQIESANKLFSRYALLLTLPICIFNAFPGRTFGRDISALIYHVRAAGSEAAELQIENTSIHFFFLRTLKLRPRVAYVCVYTYVPMCTRASRQGRGEKGGGYIGCGFGGAEISNAGHVDAKTPP